MKKPRAYYDEHDPFAARWLRNLISAGLIAPGDVDERSIKDVQATDLRGYRQCHFFAGIGVWSHALRLAGWDDDREVWTGSCPCQPFSVAGAQRGTADERHLWPEFFRLIRECRPSVVVGEQTAGPAALAWLDVVSIDLEGAGYAVGAADLCAASTGAPHIRQRLYWMGYTCQPGSGRNGGAVLGPQEEGSSEWGEARRLADESFSAGTSRRLADSGCSSGRAEQLHEPRKGLRREAVTQDGAGIGERGCADGLANPTTRGQRIDRSAPWDAGHAPQCEPACTVAYSDGGKSSNGALQRGRRLVQLAQNPLAGFWADAEWIACSDGKARPVEPKYVALSDGNPGRVGYVGSKGSEVKTENLNTHPSKTGPAALLRGLQETNAPPAIQRNSGIKSEFSEKEVLQSAVHGAGTDARGGNEFEPLARQGARCGEGGLRDLREAAETPRPSSGRESIQQCDRQFADFVLHLPSSFALAQLSGDTFTAETLLALLQASGAEKLVQYPSYEVEAVWKSLAQETQDRLRLGFEQGRFVRSFVHPLVARAPSRMGPSGAVETQPRSGRLRGYGNSLCAPVAEAFVRAAMSCLGVDPVDDHH